MPLAELHVHLEGSVEPETLLEIDPSLTRAEIDAATAYHDFAGFIKAFVWVNRFLKGPRDYALAARRLFERLAGQGVTYAEVTLSVGVVLWKQQEFAPVFDALQREAACSPIAVRWIFDAIRQFGTEPAKPVFDLAAERIGEGVVAIGLGGDEVRGPAIQFADLFREARDRGLRLTCHAGEIAGPESVWQALEIGAERIGHGIRSIDDPKLVEHLSSRRVPLEVCITSNVRTGAVSSLAEHPVKRLYDAGVPIILSTDDPALFACTLTSEYELARREFGFTSQELGAIAANSFRHAFSSQPTDDFDRILPASITKASVRNVNEWVIPLPEVKQAIRLATEHLIAVLGVESFRILANGLGVVGYTGYEFEFIGNWPGYVRQNNGAALRYIEENQLGQGYGYILTVSSENEFRTMSRPR